MHNKSNHIFLNFFREKKFFGCRDCFQFLVFLLYLSRLRVLRGKKKKGSEKYFFINIKFFCLVISIYRRPKIAFSFFGHLISPTVSTPKKFFSQKKFKKI